MLCSTVGKLKQQDNYERFKDNIFDKVLDKVKD